MPNELSIYFIIVFNALVQLMLISRLKFPAGAKWKYCALTIAIPVLVWGSMRLAIAFGLMPARVADQTPTEQLITTTASFLLIGGPWLVTVLAVISKKRRRALVETPGRSNDAP